MRPQPEGRKAEFPHDLRLSHVPETVREFAAGLKGERERAFLVVLDVPPEHLFAVRERVEEVSVPAGRSLLIKPPNAAFHAPRSDTSF